jgi:hypothetical protein
MFLLIPAPNSFLKHKRFFTSNIMPRLNIPQRIEPSFMNVRISEPVPDIPDTPINTRPSKPARSIIMFLAACVAFSVGFIVDQHDHNYVKPIVTVAVFLLLGFWYRFKARHTFGLVWFGLFCSVFLVPELTAKFACLGLAMIFCFLHLFCKMIGEQNDDAREVRAMGGQAIDGGQMVGLGFLVWIAFGGGGVAICGAIVVSYLMYFGK